MNWHNLSKTFYNKLKKFKDNLKYKMWIWDVAYKFETNPSMALCQSSTLKRKHGHLLRINSTNPIKLKIC